MKNFLDPKRFANISLVQKAISALSGFRLVAVMALSFALVSIAPLVVSLAQKPSKVWNVATQPSADGTVVWITADAPLSRAQNWQDSEGYHLVLPNTVSGDALKTVPGVKIRRVGKSVEVLLQTKPGSRVSVQSEGNEISLLVDKKLDSTSVADSRADVKEGTSSVAAAETAVARRDNLALSSAAGDLASKSQGSSTVLPETPPGAGPPLVPIAATPTPTQPPRKEAWSGVSTPPQAQTPISVQPEDEGLMASIFSLTSLCVVVALGLFGFLVSRKLRSRQARVVTARGELASDADWLEDATTSEGTIRTQGEQSKEPGTSMVRSGSSGMANNPSRKAVARVAVAGPTTLYGAYRIDQEVGKLILGQPHRMDVLASRAVDDRRAIEASLIKGVNAADVDESARRRAREALEEYGFVARQCATLLLAPDAFERTSAARALGEIKSDAALPFLLEGLYDSESIVRNQAVVSIGELKLPSAIGALLDIARTHPDVPSGLLSRTLSACSVEGLDFFDALPIEPAQLGMGHELSMIEQITHLAPASSVAELPQDVEDDENLARALALVESDDVQERAEALKILTQFRVQSAVEATTRVARHDSESNLRSLAISSLGTVDHESAFPAILIGMTDESREVRASAARALNRLSFDRADAYVRVIETSDHETLANVAKAAVQAGIVSQNLDRLATSDHRQTYETFSLICLLARANMNEPVCDAIAEHPNLEVRLRAVHLFAQTGHPSTFEQLRQLAVRDGVREEVKTALLEAMYKLDQQAKLQGAEVVEPTAANEEAGFEFVTAETVEAPAESGFEFSFGPASSAETDAEFETAVQQEPDDPEG